MKLSEYLRLTETTILDFAKQTGISVATINNILRGYDTKLSTAMHIERFTNRIVKCSDIEPTEQRPYKKKSPSSQKEAPDHPES